MFSRRCSTLEKGLYRATPLRSGGQVLCPCKARHGLSSGSLVCFASLSLESQRWKCRGSSRQSKNGHKFQIHSMPVTSSLLSKSQGTQKQLYFLEAKRLCMSLHPKCGSCQQTFSSASWAWNNLGYEQRIGSRTQTQDLMLNPHICL